MSNGLLSTPDHHASSTTRLTMAYAHNNNASRCLIDLDKIIASGAFKNVYEGDYTEGKRAGEKCVSKQFKSGSVHEVDCFSEELRVIKRAQAILDNWYAAHVISRQNRILLNRPEMWEFEDGPQAGIKHLAEPFIDHFEKFNSNTGWAPIVSCTLARRPQTSAVVLTALAARRRRHAFFLPASSLQSVLRAGLGQARGGGKGRVSHAGGDDHGQRP